MKRLNVLLCGIAAACILTGCGQTVPELTEEENDIITEYAVNLLLKYDKNYNDHLVELPAYEEPVIEPEYEEPEPEEILPEEEENIPETEVIDATEEIEPVISSIEEFYGIPDFTFQYTGYELLSEYPSMAQDSASAFFAMEATPGTQLLIVKFQVTNQSGMESVLDTFQYGVKVKIAVNGEASKNALSTMLLNDLQTYRGTLEAYGQTELVAVIEVPQGTSVANLSLLLKSDSDSATMTLQ
ncbi:MAG: hypothetical protein NC434_15440 [Ruminococcus sp.]|nr:hypothetical protein [Ruminococcus sp.]